MFDKRQQIAEGATSSDIAASVGQLVYAIVFDGNFTSHLDEIPHRQRVRPVVYIQHTHTNVHRTDCVTRPLNARTLTIGPVCCGFFAWICPKSCCGLVVDDVIFSYHRVDQ